MIQQQMKELSSASATLHLTHLHRLFIIIYTLSKVRGHKTIVTFVPHDVTDLEPVLKLLIQHTYTSSSAAAASSVSSSADHWQTRYSLLLWLSILVLIPFDLMTVDSHSTVIDGRSHTLISALIHIGQHYLADTGASRDIAAFMLAKLFSRRDLSQQHLTDYIQYCHHTLNINPHSNSSTSRPAVQLTLSLGILSSLVNICKYGSRDVLQQHLSLLASLFLQSADTSTNSDPTVLLEKQAAKSVMMRKLLMKLYQRLALIFVKPKIATWRYQRGQRSLLDNLQTLTAPSASTHTDTTTDTNTDTDTDATDAADAADEDEEDIPSELESIVSLLLDGLRDSDTIVRWSAAKVLVV